MQAKKNDGIESVLSPVMFVENLDVSPKLMATMAAVAMLLVSPADAHANQYGIFAGRTASLMHPTTMGLLFGTSIYAGYLGLQWRRLRGMTDEIKDVKKQAPSLSNGPMQFPVADTTANIQAKLAALGDTEEGKEPKSAAASTLRGDLQLLAREDVLALDVQVSELTDTRKRLQGAKLKDKHELTGSWLLGAGVTVAILGAFNTYMRAGKLFPGPHLYAGMACTILWAVAASFTPAMAKGDEKARLAHISLNSINVVLFAWQVVSGIPILLKVIEKTSWP